MCFMYLLPRMKKSASFRFGDCGSVAFAYTFFAQPIKFQLVVKHMEPHILFNVTLQFLQEVILKRLDLSACLAY